MYLVSAIAGGVTGTAKLNVQGPPRLARMELVPDTVVIPYGASQLFTIKGYDQYDSAFVVTSPVWSVTGAGNSVTQAGAVTTGTNPGVVTAIKDSISSSAVFTLDYICTFNKRYEAETASSKGSGPTLETTTDTSGSQNFTGIVSGNWFAYNKLSIPVAGLYTIHFRISTTAAAKIRLENNGKTYGIINLPSTGGVWTTISDTITLPAINYFNVRAHQGSFKFNWFSIDNCAIDTGSSMLARSGTVQTSTSAGVKDEQDLLLAKEVLNAYPNPTTGVIVISIPARQYTTARLVDANGKLVRQWAVGANETRIVKDLSFLNPGYYILRLDGTEKSGAVKVIKQ